MIGLIYMFMVCFKVEGKLMEEVFFVFDVVVNVEVVKVEVFVDDGIWEFVDDLLKDVYMFVGVVL